VNNKMSEIEMLSGMASSAQNKSQNNQNFGNSMINVFSKMIQGKLEHKWRVKEMKTMNNLNLEYQRQQMIEQEQFFKKHNIPAAAAYGVKPMIMKTHGGARPHYAGYQPDLSMVQDRLGIY
jgi:hypothetical protein